ncbi:DNA-binding MarR family transcriptional regulator [Leucobacter exalbidus]|uniref:DNA-binding MarR family transcriptional regulator n=1 Tax=Leucobacter exalbidus TaxID=662960 RepID=A0A940T493_9MICO|nr:MarR family transcriptional regulator [Leucobacter exalbidus]MBP1326594.1 DNA-binding MarR family transcriptional regulator [Leucobacter exalbidus]
MTNDSRATIWGNLLFGQRSILLRLTAELKRDFGLTIAQFEALRALTVTHGEPVNASELGRALLYSSGSTTNLLKQLERMSLISRTACPSDARIVLIDLTPAGVDLISRASAAHLARVEEEFFALIPDEDLATIAGFAQRLTQQEGLDALRRPPHAATAATPEV